MKEILTTAKTATALLQVASLGKFCPYDASYLLPFIEKAFDIEEKIHVKGSNHNHLAKCFATFGKHLMDEGNGVKGLEYLKKAIKMYQEMNLVHANDYADIRAMTGLALIGVSPNEAEKNLRIAETIFKTNLKDHNRMVFLQINSSLLRIFMYANRVEDGLELCQLQKRLIDSTLSKSDTPNLRLFNQMFWLSLFYESSGQRKMARELYIDLITRVEQQIDPRIQKTSFHVSSLIV